MADGWRITTAPTKRQTMFPTISADSGITITDTELGISVLAIGFTSGVIDDDFSQSFMVDTTDPDPLAHPWGASACPTGLGSDCRSENRPIDRCGTDHGRADPQRSWHCQGPRPRSS
jgi:hypothetical protein